MMSYNKKNTPPPRKYSCLKKSPESYLASRLAISLQKTRQEKNILNKTTKMQ